MISMTVQLLEQVDSFLLLMSFERERDIDILIYRLESFTIDLNSECSSRATAFLDNTRNNIHILLNTQVTRVTFVEPNNMDF